MSAIEIALTLVVITVVLLVALIPLAAYSWTIFDIIFRIDFGVISKVFWLGVVLAVPLAGLLIYWMVRPKRYDPLYEKDDDTYVVIPSSRPVMATAEPPRLRLVPNDGATVDDEPAVSLERAA